MKSPAALLDIVTNLDGETTKKLSINADGKLFDLLADKVYTDKVKACVRELLSNAVDSHVDAGQTRPIKVTLPTNLDPVFTVRDYGTGMDDATVDGVYSTLMDTTKGDDNTQTGFLGIGSKSPFAVSDAFTVVCYDGAFQRTYLVARSADGVPGITLLGSDLSQEPQGVEVQVPVAQTQVREFHQKAEVVAFGMAHVDIEGFSFDQPEATLSGAYIGTTPEGDEDVFQWEVVDADFLDENYYVRQGVVVYPVPYDARPLHGEPLKRHCSHSLIVDIPLGTADVSPDRESLSLDETTRANVRTAFETVYGEVKAAAAHQRENTSNWLQQTNVAASQEHWLASSESSNNFLYAAGGSDWDVPTLLEGKKWGGLISAPVFTNRRHPLAPDTVEVGKVLRVAARHVADHVFYVLRPGTVRAVDRVRRDAKARHNNGRYYSSRGQTSNNFHVLDNPTPRQIERLVTLFGLRADQIVPVASIPDEKPPSKARAVVASDGTRRVLPKRLSGVYSFDTGSAELLEALPEDYLWVRSESRAGGHLVQGWGRFVEQASLNHVLPIEVAEYLDLPSTIIGLSPKAIETYSPDPAKELHVAIAAAVTDEVKDAADLARSVSSAVRNLYVGGPISDQSTVVGLVEPFLPEGYDLSSTAHRALLNRWFDQVASHRGWGHTDTVADAIEAQAKALYPMLFTRHIGDEEVNAYVALVKAAATTEEA